MRSWLRNTSCERVAVSFAAGASLTLASLANFLSHNDYPYLRSDVGIVAVGFLFVCVLMAYFYNAQRQWGRSFLEGLLAALFVDFNGDSLWLVAATGLSVAAFTAVRRTSLLGPMAILGSVIFLTTAAGIGVRSSWIGVTHENHARSPATNEPRSTVLHIILDEHIGIEGLPRDDDVAQRLRAKLNDYYVNAGFAVYGGAYSEHLHTVNAIPNMLNYGNGLAHKASLRGVRIGQTAHLQGLQNQGYRVTVLQSEFADYCSGSSFYKCITYDSSALSPTLDASLGFRDRSSLILFKFLSLSTIAEKAFLSWNVITHKLRHRGWRIPAAHLELLEGTSTIGSLTALDNLAIFLRKAQLGEVYFAHLLLPHYPYVVNENCEYLPRDAWDRRRSASRMEIRLHAYYRQIECTTKKVGFLIKAIEDSAVGNNAVIIIHGDHGSRITTVDPNEPNLGKFSTQDVIAGFSTLFAVRGPQVIAGYTPQPQPVSTLLRDFAAADFRTAPPANRPLRDVQLDDWEWLPRQHMPLPKEWTDTLSRPIVAQQ